MTITITRTITIAVLIISAVLMVVSSDVTVTTTMDKHGLHCDKAEKVVAVSVGDVFILFFILDLFGDSAVLFCKFKL